MDTDKLNSTINNLKSDIKAMPKRIYLHPKAYEKYLFSLGLNPPYMDETDINGTIICLSLLVPNDKYI